MLYENTTWKKLKDLLVGSEILDVSEPPAKQEAGIAVFHIKQGKKERYLLLCATELGSWVHTSAKKEALADKL